MKGIDIMLDLQNMTIAELEELKKTINIILSDKSWNALNKLVAEHGGETLSTQEIANIMQCKWQAVYHLMLPSIIDKRSYHRREKITKQYVNINNPNDTMIVTKECTYYTII